MSDKFVICVDSGEHHISLDVGEVYDVVENHVNLESDDIVVIDNTGEAYIYPKSYFSKEIAYSLVEEVKRFLGKDGIDFFKECLLKYGTVSPVWMEYGIPHPVHFREGMQVRNFMRSTKYCDNWDSHDFDNNWITVIEKAIGE